ncbi:MAG: Maf family protein [Clostridia bacterium]|nr:Maf family protein [Clostridia bacterium]
MNSSKKLILASASPRRREILSMAGYVFDVISPDAEEYTGGDDPYTLTVENSKLKAEAALKTGEGVFICADTVVALEGMILGKPKTKDKAYEMLRSLSGKTHSVVTGYTVTDGKTSVSGYVETKVTMREIFRDEMEKYVESGEPLDKAGAYGVQGAAGVFVSQICGDYYTVVGLPLCKISEILRKNFGIFPFSQIQ